MKRLALFLFLASCLLTAQETKTFVSNLTFSVGTKQIVCRVEPEVSCVASEGMTDQDVRAALETASDKDNSVARIALQMAWKLAKPPAPITVEIPLSKTVCPDGWEVYAEYNFACAAVCIPDEHSNTCKNTCSVPRVTCRKR